MSDFNVVLLPEEQLSQELWEQIKSWRSAGIIREVFGSIGTSDGSLRIRTTDSDTVEGIYDHLARHPYDVVRLAVVQLLFRSETADNQTLAEAVDLFKTVRATAPGDTKVTLLNVLVPDAMDAVLDPNAVLLGEANVNLLAVPVDRPAPTYIARPLEGKDTFVAHSAHSVVQILGLWSGVDEGPFDALRPAPIDGAASVVVFRSYSRLLVGGLVADTIVGETLSIGTNGRWPLADTEALFVPEDAATDIARVADEFVEHHRSVLMAGRPPSIDQPQPQQSMAVGDAFRLLGRRLGSLPDDLAHEVVETGHTAVERLAQSMTFGQESTHKVSFRGGAVLPSEGDQIPMADIELLIDELDTERIRTGIAESEVTLNDLRELINGLVDGSPVPIELRSDGGKRLSVTDPKALVPPGSETLPRSLTPQSGADWESTLAALADPDVAIPPGMPACDPHDLATAQTRITSEIEEKEAELRRIAALKDDDDSAKKKAARNADEEALHQRIALLGTARDACRVITQRRSESLAWIICKTATSSLNDAVSRLREALSALKDPGGADSAATRDLRRLRTYRWILVALSMATVAMLPFWPWMNAAAQDAAAVQYSGLVAGLALTLMAAIYARAVLRFEHRRHRPGWIRQQARTDAEYYAGEVRRLHTVYRRIVSLSEVLASDLHQPWQALSRGRDELAPISEVRFPLALQIAEVDVDRAGLYVAEHRARREVYRVGWMTMSSDSALGEFGSRYLGAVATTVRDLEGGPTAANLDPASESIWSNYLKVRRSGDVGVNAAAEAEERVLDVFRDEDPGSVFSVDLTLGSAEALGVDSPDDFLEMVWPTNEDAGLVPELLSAETRVSGAPTGLHTMLIGPSHLAPTAPSIRYLVSAAQLERGRPYLNVAARVDYTDPLPASYLAVFVRDEGPTDLGHDHSLADDDF